MEGLEDPGNKNKRKGLRRSRKRRLKKILHRNSNLSTTISLHAVRTKLDNVKKERKMPRYRESE